MFDFLSEKISSIFSHFKGGKLTQSAVDEALLKVHDALIEADVPLAVVDAFVSEVKQDVVGAQLIKSLKPSEHLMKVVHDRIVTFLGGQVNEGFSFQIPSTIMVMGLQGAGKTTTLAKLAYSINEQARKRGKARRILCASVDFYRPAAIDQLEILAKAVNCDFYRTLSQEPMQAVAEIQEYATKNAYEILLLDTAGRLHVDQNMLSELVKIDKLLKPKYKFLVVDSMVGQESLHVAQAFEEAVPFTGAILTKMDSESRGGVAFAFRYMLKKPIFFVGTGERPADVEQFRPERIASRIIGMGDMMSLVEKANEKIKESDQKRLYRSMTQGKMTLEDFAQQMSMVSSLGSISSLMKYLPGMGGMKISPDMIEKGEREVKKFRAIISSMTLKERLCPQILDSSRKQRIARGAGVAVADIGVLLSRFEESQQFVKILKKTGRF